MSGSHASDPVAPLPTLDRHTVLLIDDQPMIGEVVRRMVANEPDVDYHYLNDPTKALDKAREIRPTLILQDLVMPQIDGLELVRQFRELDETREIPMVVLSAEEDPKTKAEAFAIGANDYMVKLPDRLEVLARIRYHSRGYLAVLQRNQAYRELAASQKLLADEVASAARYVRRLLPETITEGPVRTDWRYIPSVGLSGDTFGYQWLDQDHFAAYLLDVAGHGVGAALLSVSVLNALRSQSLPGVDFLDPGQVISALNNRFPMEQQGEKNFTAWYGVYHVPSRELRYAAGSHPYALLQTGPSSQDRTLSVLEGDQMVIGVLEDFPYETKSIVVDKYAKFYLFSDGCYEIKLPDNRSWPFEEFLRFMTSLKDGEPVMDRLMEHTRALSGQDHWEDDFSIVEFTFL
ncbi:MAG: hypothetical protein KatS3mg108_3488 [Isosphaeraceae bacterium]|nr:MAG: hypothetical protein KatS3mg108_3488 [Isosphaeraceae bacterium]